MTCPICLEEMGESAHCLPCGHIYCTQCTESLTRNTRTRSGHVNCPSCRARFIPRMSEDSVRKVFLNHTSPSSPHSSSSPTPIAAQETNHLRVLLEAARQERDDALWEVDQLNSLQNSYLESLANIRRETMFKTTEINRLKAQLREADYALRQAQASHNVYRTFTQREIDDIKKTNETQQNEIRDLKTKLSVFAQKKEASPSATVKREPNNWLSAAFQYGFDTPEDRVNVKNECVPIPPALGATLSKPNASQSTTTPALTSIAIQSRQVARLPTHHRGRVIPLNRGQAINTNTPQSKDIASSSLSVASSAPAPAKKREFKSGSAILWRGYGCPKSTAVLECTAQDGYHRFSGKGTNQYATKYTCNICYFSCSESRR